LSEADLIHDELKRQGWSLAEFAVAGVWAVTGTRGKQRLYALGHSQSEAWEHAAGQALLVARLGDTTN
jgi:hypothetical protein